MRRLRMASITALCIGAAVLAGGCAGENKKAEIPQAEESSALTEENDSDTAMTIEFWHYYNDAQKQHLDQLVKEYNGTLGLERGVAVEAYSQGSIADLTNTWCSTAPPMMWRWQILCLPTGTWWSTR